ncbi:MAG: zinc ribbon domain-containing protein [Oscillospiraceae bacterium]|nr:zinc ribbon domain-containing protein [Oscillospiraceae bacterium]
MSFCQNCGTELGEGARFCSKCGQDQQTSVPDVRPTRTGNSRRLHCPECKSSDIAPIVETAITGGTALNHSFSKKNSVSAMQFNNTHRNYWMCSSCGCKFRNIQNLEAEIKSTQSLLKRNIIGTILCVFLTVLLTIMSGFNPFLIFLNVLLAAQVFYYKNRIAKLSEERAYLKKKCFN